MKWTTKNGEELDIREMETSHILNCLSFLERQKFVTLTTGREVLAKKYKVEFNKELKKRGNP